MKPPETPKLDYWMIPILQKAVSMYMSTKTKKCPPEYIQRWIQSRNQFHPISQLNLISERLNEIQVRYDIEIRAALSSYCPYGNDRKECEAAFNTRCPLFSQDDGVCTAYIEALKVKEWPPK